MDSSETSQSVHTDVDIPPDTSTDMLSLKRKDIIPHTSHMTDDIQTKILASLVPDEIIYNIDDYSIRSYSVAVIMGDVSGFTDLSEKFNKAGMGGPSRLTEILNGYIGSMVQEILMRDGDVLKFSGDAFLATWKVREHRLIQDCVNQALDCAIAIQKDYGQFETDAQVVLRVKLALAAGDVSFSVIGTEVMKHYVLAGKPIWDVKLAEYLCSSGDIVVSPSAWQYVDTPGYLHEYMPDGRHIRVKGLGPSWRNIHKIRVQRHEDEQDGEDDLYPVASSDRIPDPEAAPLLMVLTGEKIDSRASTIPSEFQLRPSINEAVKKKMKDSLKPYVIKPVVQGLENKEPLEYLTEMRQVVTVFINLIISLSDVTTFLYLVNECFKHVCRLVVESNGCVNKVSLFDKDVMLLVIFGLRGLKHDLESQIALRCAAQIREVLIKLPDVLNASIGVTTGMTYCGVVGHSLRREYTVIGVSVNKAARLMVAYPGKVTCDRDVFLHAGLDASHFILQEPKELKGLSSIGPIYEFKEQSYTEQGTDVVKHKFPLLGRAEELKQFKKLLSAMLSKGSDNSKSSRVKYSAMLIEGQPRQGKTRLLDEMLYNYNQGVQAYKVTLSLQDYHVPFSGIQYIFAPPLGLSACASAKEREEILMKKMGHSKKKDYFWSLNSVFNVNFGATQISRELNASQRTAMLHKMIRTLFCECFKEICMIGIDNCEFLDDESWKFFPDLLEDYRVLFILTLGNRGNLGESGKITLEHRSICKLSLSGISRMFLSGLACQILDVSAIPPELVKILHDKSNGNPGWIESYLISLIQAGALSIQSISKHKAEGTGLVIPAEDMLVRKENTMGTESDLSSNGKDKTEKFADDDIDYGNFEWGMYPFSDESSKRSLEGVESAGSEDNIAVCTVTPNFVLEDFSTELTMNVMMIKMFDSLSTNEQLILKCSSVIGEIFSRHMMVSLMNNPPPRDIALAVKRLFEVRILACANVDVTKSASFTAMQHAYSLRLDHGIRCDCVGVVIDPSCKDLPLYASCGYLKFRVPLFRETTYNLLLENQKHDFHSRAIKYLRRETKRCSSCGGGNFSRILGQDNAAYGLDLTYDVNMPKSVTAEHANISSSSQDNLFLLSQINYEEMLLTKLRQSTAGDPVLSGTGAKNIAATRSNAVRTPPSRSRFDCLRCFRPKKINSHISLTRSFSSVDFTNCKCSSILTSMYIQLVEHCRRTGRQDLTMDALLEYTEICFSSFNYPQALRLLNDAQSLLTTKPSNEDSAIPLWKYPLIRGKINTLLGYARLELGQLEEASHILHLAMKEFQHPFPTQRYRIHMACLYQMFKHVLMCNVFPRLMIGQASGYDAVFSNEMSDCLSILCSLFANTKQWKSAKLAALWSLNKALEANDDFYGVCTAYSKLIQMAHIHRNTGIGCRLEKAALDVCRRKTTRVESIELEAVCRLYFSIFMARVRRAELSKAINLGFKTLRLSNTIHFVHLRLKIIPSLIEVLMMRLRLSEAVSLLNDIDFASGEETDKTGRIWYYAKCVDLQLYTGFTLLPFRKCEDFFQKEGETLIALRNPDAEHRYYMVMWLWSVRNEDWEAATVWYQRARENFDLQPYDSLSNVVTALRLLEGLLVHLAGKVDSRNIKAVTEAYSDINTEIDKLSKAIKICIVALPRFLILKAYYRHIRFHDSAAFKLLEQAKETALQQENLLDAAWAEHNGKVWNGTISPIFLDYWKEHCRGEQFIDWHEAEMRNQKMMLYSLPAPRYNI